MLARPAYLFTCTTCLPWLWVARSHSQPKLARAASLPGLPPFARAASPPWPSSLHAIQSQPVQPWLGHLAMPRSFGHRVPFGHPPTGHRAPAHPVVGHPAWHPGLATQSLWAPMLRWPKDVPCGVSFIAPRVFVTFTLYTHQISVGFSLSRNQQLQMSAFTEEFQLNIVLGRFHSNKTGLNLDCRSEKT